MWQGDCVRERGELAPVTHEDMVRLFGSLRVVTYPGDAVRALGVSAVASRTLIQVGLPNAVGTLFTSASLEPCVVPGVGDGIRFGEGWYDEFAMCVVPTEEVYATHLPSGETTRVNTDLARFAGFLYRAGLVSDRWDEAEAGELPKEEYLRLVHQCQAELHEVDAEALEDGWWWTGIVGEFTMI